MSGIGVFLCGLVITGVVSKSDNSDKIRKLSCHVSYILVSCTCESTDCSKGSNSIVIEHKHALYFIIQLLAQQIISSSQLTKLSQFHSPHMLVFH